MAWWYIKERKVVGPLDAKSLEYLFDKTEMPTSTMICCNGMEEWASYEGLKRDFGDDVLFWAYDNFQDFDVDYLPPNPFDDDLSDGKAIQCETINNDANHKVAENKTMEKQQHNNHISQKEKDTLIAELQNKIDSIEINDSSNKEDIDRIRNKVFSALPQLESQQEQSIGKIINNYDKMNKSLHDEENRKSNNIGIVWMLCLCIGPFAFHAIGAGLLMSVVISIIIAFVASREMK